MASEEGNPLTEMKTHIFPAKLWRLVNDPHYSSIQWDSCGEGVMVDQALFEAELLVPSRELYGPYEVFKVSSFGSFVRQLNLYGFKKTAYKAGVRAGDHSVHRFCNRFFRREHPELLANLKRMTTFNKAKMAAGLKVLTRPQNRYQRLLASASDEQRMAENEGLVPVEQIHRFSRRENICPKSYAGSVFQNHSASSMKEFGDAPVSIRMWPTSLEPHKRHLMVPSPFPEKPFYLPIMHQFPAEVAYTLQSTAATLHVQQSHSVMMESAYNNRSSYPVQYPNVYYPAGGFQCCPPPYMEHLSNFSDPAVLYQPYNYYQGPQAQASFPMQFYYPNLPNNCSNDHGNFSTAIQVIDGLQTSSQLPETLDHSQTNQLECVLPVNMDFTTCAVGSYQAVPFLQRQAYP